MIASPWQKQNTPILKAGLVATVGVFVVIKILVLLSLLEKNWLTLIATLLLATVVVILTLRFSKSYAKSMIRILRFDSEDTEWAVRNVFKGKNISFNLKIEQHWQTREPLYIFKFPSPGLTLTIEPYESFDLQNEPISATKVALDGLNERNKALATMLADAIDEMVNQQASKFVKA
ncbi:MAG: hypothetical protein AAF629_24730 [Chloroflexota bacterium]